MNGQRHRKNKGKEQDKKPAFQHTEIIPHTPEGASLRSRPSSVAHNARGLSVRSCLPQAVLQATASGGSLRIIARPSDGSQPVFLPSEYIHGEEYGLKIYYPVQ